MIAKIGQGDRMSGLMVYLVGPGRANEHTTPHLVAGDAAMMEWHHDVDPTTGEAVEVGRDQGLRIARHLDRPRRAFETTVAGGHVLHCSLSLAAREGQLSDEKWRQISEAFVEGMGLGDHDGTKAPARWVAVRHGLSSGGNDHVHLVVNLVREDGSKADIHQYKIRSRDLCRELEKEFGLEELESAGRERASVGFEYGEREAAARRRARGQFEQARRAGVEAREWSQLPAGERGALIEAATTRDQPRWELARKVRACATSSVDEAEFVRRLRQHGVLARPRFAESERGRARRTNALAAGSGLIVVGYSVAARPAAGERPIWYGGGHLAKDLTLPRLRSEWALNASVGGADSQRDAGAAAAEWSAAARGRRPAAPGREVSAVDPHVWVQVNVELRELREQLQGVAADDREAWARVARETAGAFSAWSTRVESTPGPLAAAADTLARSAETTRSSIRRAPDAAASVAGGGSRASRVALPSAAGAAYLLLAASSGNAAAGQLVVMRQLMSLAMALKEMHRAEGAARRAHAIERAVRGELVTVRDRLTATVPSVGTAVSAAPDATREAPSTQHRYDTLESPLVQADERAVEAARLARRAHGPQRPAAANPAPEKSTKSATEKAAETVVREAEARRRREAIRRSGPDRGPDLDP